MADEEPQERPYIPRVKRFTAKELVRTRLYRLGKQLPEKPMQKPPGFEDDEEPKTD
jgi:hypothetical protein